MVWTVKPDKMEISPLKAYFMMIKAGYKFYRICQLDRMKENEIFSFTGAAIIKLANVSFGQKSLDVDFMICAQPPLPHSLSFFFLSLLWSPFFLSFSFSFHHFLFLSLSLCLTLVFLPPSLLRAHRPLQTDFHICLSAQ